MPKRKIEAIQKKSYKELIPSNLPPNTQLDIIKNLKTNQIEAFCNEIMQGFVDNIRSGLTPIRAFKHFSLKEIIILAKKYEKLIDLTITLNLPSHSSIASQFKVMAFKKNQREICLNWRDIISLDKEFQNKIKTIADKKHIPIQIFLDYSINEYRNLTFNATKHLPYIIQGFIKNKDFAKASKEFLPIYNLLKKPENFAIFISAIKTKYPNVLAQDEIISTDYFSIRELCLRIKSSSKLTSPSSGAMQSQTSVFSTQGKFFSTLENTIDDLPNKKIKDSETEEDIFADLTDLIDLDKEFYHKIDGF